MESALTLDYAPRRTRPWHIPSLASRFILTACFFIYAVACTQAMHQRGYPPLEPHLQGMALLWIVGIPLSALVERFSARRAITLALYATATAYIDAASWPMMTPHRFNLVDPLSMLPLYGPLHYAMTAVLELATRLVAALCKPLMPRQSLSIVPRIIAAIFLLVAGASIPSAYAAYDAWSLNRRGISRALDDWNNHRALIFRDADIQELPNDIIVQLHVDPATGLEFHANMGWGFEPAYNRTIADLLRRQGKPTWAAPQFPSPADLLKYLDASGFTEIKNFPFDVNPNITLIHGGSITKWGPSFSAGGPGLSIVTPHAIQGVGMTYKPTFVGRDPAFPKLLFIRDGHDSLVVLDDSGNCLVDLFKNQ
jgi:hypothetical protein